MAAKKNPYELKEVVLRLAEGHSLYGDQPIQDSSDAVWLLRKELANADREYVCLINLNMAGKPVNYNIVSVGGLDSSLFDIPNILKACMLSNCRRFVVLHNHPSGSLEPSEWDITSTRQLFAAAKLLGLACEDHIIVGNDMRYVSLRDREYVSFTTQYRLIDTGCEPER